MLMVISGEVRRSIPASCMFINKYSRNLSAAFWRDIQEKFVLQSARTIESAVLAKLAGEVAGPVAYITEVVHGHGGEVIYGLEWNEKMALDRYSRFTRTDNLAACHDGYKFTLTPVYTLPQAASKVVQAVLDEREALSWEEAEKISEMQPVEEAIGNLLSDQTGDNATALVVVISEAIAKKGNSK